MSMHKIFFGTIVFFSLAFLAACGGSGGSGSTGATGAAGAAGAAGTISVPTDANLVITASTADDTNLSLGLISKTFEIGGADNVTADSRLRYYMYEGSSATGKVRGWFSSSSITGTNTLYTAASSLTSGILDTRLKTTDNHTLTSAALIGDGNQVTYGSVSHLIICPGNEAGDATSCASAATNDRGWGAAHAMPGLTGLSLDNASRVFINEVTTTGSFDILVADGHDSIVGSAAVGDNVTSNFVVTDAKSTDNATAISFGTQTSVYTASPSDTALGFPYGADNQSAVMDSVKHGSALYILSGNDNGTLRACSSSGCTTSASNIFATGRSNPNQIGFGAMGNIILDSDGTNMIAIADNSTVIGVVNLTVPGTPAVVGGDITTVSANDQFCGAVGGGRVMVFHDNATGQRRDATSAVAAVDNSTVFFRSTPIDNTTAWEVSLVDVWALDNGTRNGPADHGSNLQANNTYGTHCAMTYGGLTEVVTGSAGHTAGHTGDNRTFYMVIDNNTSTLLYTIVDNTSHIILTGELEINDGTSPTTAEHLAIDTDSTGVPYVVIDNKTNGAVMFGTTAMSLFPNVEHDLEALGIWGAVDIKVSSDNKKIGVVGMSTPGPRSIPTIRIFYDE